MYICTLKNIKNGKIFKKSFYSEHLYRKYLKKLRHSKRIEILHLIEGNL